METPASYTDKNSDRTHSVGVNLTSRGLLIRKPPGHDADLVWPYAALSAEPLLPPQQNAAAVLTYKYMHEAELRIQNSRFLATLAKDAPHLTKRKRSRGRIWYAILAVSFALIAWSLASLSEWKPARGIATLIPASTRAEFGKQIVAQTRAKYKSCAGRDGHAALDAILVRLLPDAAERATFHLTVVNWKLVNAFAAPGRQLLLTRGMIKSAQSPEELAGVLAHEIGHGRELHPDAGVVRSIGLAATLQLIIGDGSGIVSGAAHTLLNTRYVRSDEREADRIALKLLQNAKISHDGMHAFFSRAAKAQKSEALGLFNFLSTHPTSQERADNIARVPSYPVAPLLTPAQWQSLKTICNTVR